jgi:hypothetical protein
LCEAFETVALLLCYEAGKLREVEAVPETLAALFY